MKNKLNIGFFCVCFIASLIAEFYCIFNLDWFSIIGIGIVSLILAYLLIDSIRTRWQSTMDKLKSVIDTYEEQIKLENDRYMEANKLQKATYTAIKKNTLLLNEKFDDIQKRLDAFEKKNEQMTKLQRKAMEGQKNALNIELNYNKENTEHLIETIHEELKEITAKQQMTDIEATENQIISKVDPSNTKEKAQAIKDEPEPNSQPNIIPLYDDPNKELSKEEIDQLFASYSK